MLANVRKALRITTISSLGIIFNAQEKASRPSYRRSYLSGLADRNEETGEQTLVKA